MTIAVVGRPNVGKSALFNRIVGRRISIVSEEEGVTRDRLYEKIDFFGKPVRIIDTGGIDNREDIPFATLVKNQAYIAVSEAQAIIMVVDGSVGPTVQDKEIADYLLKSGRPVILAINKIDHMRDVHNIHDFYELGIENMVGVSALHGNQVADLLEVALDKADPLDEEADNIPEGAIRVAIVGRPNVGKSTFFNAILGQDRSIVSDVAGTTRDSIDTLVQINGKPYVLVDTAGIKRKSKEKDVIEKFAHIRSENAIDKADVCILLLDSNEGMTHQERKIAKIIEDSGKGCIIFFNKWDEVKGFRMEHAKQGFIMENEFLKHCPIIFGSAQSGRNLDQVFPAVSSVYEHMNLRIGTGELNRFVEKCLQLNHPSMISGKRLRIYYTTQVEVNPPRFVLFVNYRERFDPTYLRYLINKLREEYHFIGTPFRVEIRQKAQAEEREREHIAREKKVFAHQHATKIDDDDEDEDFDDDEYFDEN